eukprot:g44154.t1
MAADNPLDVDDGGMVDKDKEDPIAVTGRKGAGGEGRRAGNGSDLAVGLLNSSAGKSLVEEESGHFGGSLIEVGSIGTDKTNIGEGTGCVEETRRLQKDLDRLGDWAKKWQLEYNVKKVRGYAL